MPDSAALADLRAAMEARRQAMEKVRAGVIQEAVLWARIEAHLMEVSDLALRPGQPTETYSCCPFWAAQAVQVFLMDQAGAGAGVQS